MFNDIQQYKKKVVLKEEMKVFKLTLFQKKINEIAMEDLDTRKLHWYYDHVCNSGKTWVHMVMVINFGAINFENKKTNDVKLS